MVFVMGDPARTHVGVLLGTASPRTPKSHVRVQTCLTCIRGPKDLPWWVYLPCTCGSWCSRPQHLPALCGQNSPDGTKTTFSFSSKQSSQPSSVFSEVLLVWWKTWEDPCRNFSTPSPALSAFCLGSALLCHGDTGLPNSNQARKC